MSYQISGEKKRSQLQRLVRYQEKSYRTNKKCFQLSRERLLFRLLCTVLPCTMFQAIANFVIHVTVLLSDQTLRMVRKKMEGEYKKKKWREEDMQQAVQKCLQEGWSVRQAASVLNVPRSTLSDRYQQEKKEVIQMSEEVFQMTEEPCYRLQETPPCKVNGCVSCNL